MHSTDTLDTLRTSLDIDARRWPDRGGEYHATCPFCGKEAKRGQTHFSIYRYESGYAFKCHYCQKGGGLRALLNHLRIDAPIDTTRPAVRPVAPPKPRQWQQHPERWLDGYLGATDRLQAWQSYKPLSIDSISAWRLGVGVLPSSRCQHKRLIVPVFDGGEIVAFHGRAYLPGDTDAKWLTAGGSRKDVLFNAERLQPRRVVVIVENMVDAILLMQQRPAWVAVASGGVAWNDEFTRQIIDSKPASVIVWLDNDLAGCPNEQTYGRLLQTWHQDMQARVAAGKIPRIPAEPEPRGPMIVASFKRRKFSAVQQYRWAADAPPKADVGSLMSGAN